MKSLDMWAGMGLLAASFSDDLERGKVMGIAIGGLSLGIVGKSLGIVSVWFRESNIFQ